MKFRIVITMLLAVLLLSGLTGCTIERMDDTLDAAEDMVEDRIDAAEDAVENAVQTAVTPAPEPTAGTTAALTREQAEAIALEYVGLTADQVTRLRTEYEIDDGVAQYDVQFYEGIWEYEFEINAETGQIISFDKDD